MSTALADFIRSSLRYMRRPDSGCGEGWAEWERCLMFLGRTVPVCVLRADPPADWQIRDAVRGYFARDYSGCQSGPLMRTLDRGMRAMLDEAPWESPRPAPPAVRTRVRPAARCLSPDAEAVLAHAWVCGLLDPLPWRVLADKLDDDGFAEPARRCRALAAFDAEAVDRTPRVVFDRPTVLGEEQSARDCIQADYMRHTPDEATRLAALLAQALAPEWVGEHEDWAGCLEAQWYGLRLALGLPCTGAGAVAQRTRAAARAAMKRAWAGRRDWDDLPLHDDLRHGEAAVLNRRACALFSAAEVASTKRAATQRACPAATAVFYVAGIADLESVASVASGTASVLEQVRRLLARE